MNLNELKDKAYKTACEHGFHDAELSNEHFLCLVISELMEAVEADRKGKRANVSKFLFWQTQCEALAENERDTEFVSNFNEFIKDTVEDELADAVIRLLDLAGLRGWDIQFREDIIEETQDFYADETFTESIYEISTMPERYAIAYNFTMDVSIIYMTSAIFGLAKHLNIDLMWHIEQKMRYNELRPMKHGKKY